MIALSVVIFPIFPRRFIEGLLRARRRARRSADGGCRAVPADEGWFGCDAVRVRPAHERRSRTTRSALSRKATSGHREVEARAGRTTAVVTRRPPQPPILRAGRP